MRIFQTKNIWKFQRHLLDFWQVSTNVTKIKRQRRCSYSLTNYIAILLIYTCEHRFSGIEPTGRGSTDGYIKYGKAFHLGVPCLGMHIPKHHQTASPWTGGVPQIPRVPRQKATAIQGTFNQSCTSTTPRRVGRPHRGSRDSAVQENLGREVEPTDIECR